MTWIIVSKKIIFRVIIIVENILFEFNKADLQVQSQQTLDKVVLAMLTNDKFNIELERLPIIHHEQDILQINEIPTTIIDDDKSIEIAEQDYGLICPSSGKLIPLKSFHIRAQIIDTTVEVIK